MVLSREDIIERLDIHRSGDSWRVNARESADLEFKAILDLHTFKKSLKTVLAFANARGGMIVFGVSDRPRNVIGIGVQNLDEGVQSEHLKACISPCPDTNFLEFDYEGIRLAALLVSSLAKAPAIAIKDVLDAGGQSHVLKQGMVYARRRGQTAAITGQEFSQILISRDERIRAEIFGYFSRGRSIGFDKAVVVDPRSNADAQGDDVTFYLPLETARELNVIDRARLVETDGAPAYEILGNVQLTVPNDRDPRRPLRSADSAAKIRESIRQALGMQIPWEYSHLKQVTSHLGFWPNSDGDGVHTGREPLTNTTIYYEAGRNAVLNLARQNPNEFVDVAGSAATRAAWLARIDNAD